MPYLPDQQLIGQPSPSMQVSPTYQQQLQGYLSQQGLRREEYDKLRTYGLTDQEIALLAQRGITSVNRSDINDVRDALHVAERISSGETLKLRATQAEDIVRNGSPTGEVLYSKYNATIGNENVSIGIIPLFQKITGIDLGLGKQENISINQSGIQSFSVTMPVVAQAPKINYASDLQSKLQGQPTYIQAQVLGEEAKSLNSQAVSLQEQLNAAKSRGDFAAVNQISSQIAVLNSKIQSYQIVSKTVNLDEYSKVQSDIGMIFNAFKTKSYEEYVSVSTGKQAFVGLAGEPLQSSQFAIESSKLDIATKEFLERSIDIGGTNLYEILHSSTKYSTYLGNPNEPQVTNKPLTLKLEDIYPVVGVTPQGIPIVQQRNIPQNIPVKIYEFQKEQEQFKVLNSIFQGSKYPLPLIGTSQQGVQFAIFPSGQATLLASSYMSQAQQPVQPTYSQFLFMQPAASFFSGNAAVLAGFEKYSQALRVQEQQLQNTFQQAYGYAQLLPDVGRIPGMNPRQVGEVGVSLFGFAADVGISVLHPISYSLYSLGGEFGAIARGAPKEEVGVRYGEFLSSGSEAVGQLITFGGFGVASDVFKGIETATAGRGIIVRSLGIAMGELPKLGVSGLVFTSTLQKTGDIQVSGLTALAGGVGGLSLVGKAAPSEVKTTALDIAGLMRTEGFEKTSLNLESVSSLREFEGLRYDNLEKMVSINLPSSVSKPMLVETVEIQKTLGSVFPELIYEGKYARVPGVLFSYSEVLKFNTFEEFKSNLYYLLPVSKAVGTSFGDFMVLPSYETVSIDFFEKAKTSDFLVSGRKGTTRQISRLDYLPKLRESYEKPKEEVSTKVLKFEEVGRKSIMLQLKPEQIVEEQYELQYKLVNPSMNADILSVLSVTQERIGEGKMVMAFLAPQIPKTVSTSIIKLSNISLPKQSYKELSYEVQQLKQRESLTQKNLSNVMERMSISDIVSNLVSPSVGIQIQQKNINLQNINLGSIQINIPRLPANQPPIVPNIPNIPNQSDFGVPFGGVPLFGIPQESKKKTKPLKIKEGKIEHVQARSLAGVMKGIIFKKRKVYTGFEVR